MAFHPLHQSGSLSDCPAIGEINQQLTLAQSPEVDPLLPPAGQHCRGGLTSWFFSFLWYFLDYFLQA